MKNIIIIGLVIFLLIITGVGAFHMYNIDKQLSWNPMHNMIKGEKIEGKIEGKMDMNGMEMGEKKGMMGMGNMAGMGNIKNNQNNNSGIFPTDIENLPEAKHTEVIKLKDGDTYEMLAYPVKQEVGNRVVRRLSYNGMIPGPILQIEKGAKIKLKFTNKLGVETTLHSHGLRLDDSKFDGLPTTMGGEQKPMKPEETFVYELNFPDTGVFWYHPHIREDYTQEMGLYGNFNVTEKDYWSKVDKDGKTQKLKLVGGDIGRIEKEKTVSNQIIAPAERYIVETVFNTPGTYIIKSKNRKLGEIIVNGKNTNISLGKLRENPQDYKIIRDNLDKFLNKKADKKITLTIGRKGMKGGMGMMGAMGNDGDEIEWEDNMAMMNARSNDKMMEWKIIDEETGKEDMDINWKFKKGQFVKIEIYNDPNSMHPMQHPVYFHGQRFIVLSRDGKVQDNLQWKDTTLVKNGEKIEILIQMTNPGIWMSHCHIAEHLQSGMMMTFRVEE